MRPGASRMLLHPTYSATFLARCELDGPYARPCALAVEVEAAGLISWSLGCSGNLRKVMCFTCCFLQRGHTNPADLAGAHHCHHSYVLRGCA